jgi:hypothetical protein
MPLSSTAHPVGGKVVASKPSDSCPKAKKVKNDIKKSTNFFIMLI